jgi:hypothetical protein
MSHHENRHWSFVSLPLEAAPQEVGVHMTESHPFWQSIGIKRSMEISDSAFLN